MDNSVLYEHGYCEPEEPYEMSYEQIMFLGKRLNSESKTYKHVINTGYLISTKDEYLLNDLKWNEKYKNGIIDWDAFKEGKTVLFATNGRAYGCTHADHYNRVIQLNEIIDENFYEELTR